MCDQEVKAVAALTKSKYTGARVGGAENAGREIDGPMCRARNCRT